MQAKMRAMTAEKRAVRAEKKAVSAEEKAVRVDKQAAIAKKHAVIWYQRRNKSLKGITGTAVPLPYPFDNIKFGR